MIRLLMLSPSMAYCENLQEHDHSLLVIFGEVPGNPSGAHFVEIKSRRINHKPCNHPIADLDRSIWSVGVDNFCASVRIFMHLLITTKSSQHTTVIFPYECPWTAFLLPIKTNNCTPIFYCTHQARSPLSKWLTYQPACSQGPVA